MSGSSVIIFPIIHIEPVSRGSFTSRQCLCRGPRGRSAVIKQHAVCFYHANDIARNQLSPMCCWFVVIPVVHCATTNTNAGQAVQLWKVVILPINYLGTSSVNPSAASLSSWSEPPAPEIDQVCQSVLEPTKNMDSISDLLGWEVRLSSPSLNRTIETSFTNYSSFFNTSTLWKQL